MSVHVLLLFLLLLRVLLYCDHLRPVFAACSLSDLNPETEDWQDRTIERMSEEMPERMSDRMSEDMPDGISDRMPRDRQ